MEPTKDNKQETDYVYTAHAVAFLDLLGHKEKLQGIEGLIEGPVTEANKQQVMLTLRETVGAIWAFRKAFSEIFETLVNHPVPPNVPLHIASKFIELRKYSKMNFQSFSDSTIAWTRIEQKNELSYANTLNSVHGILAVIGVLSLIYLAKGVPFRGGVDIEGGVLITPGGNEIYGPVLNRAYNLECKVANYPRVLIGSGVIKLLDDASKMQFQDHIIGQHCKSTADKCRKWIVADDDGQLMIHFLGPQALELSLSMGPNFNADIFKPMEQFILDSQRKFHLNEKLKEKYDLLRNYFDRYVIAWR